MAQRVELKTKLEELRKINPMLVSYNVEMTEGITTARRPAQEDGSRNMTGSGRSNWTI